MSIKILGFTKTNSNQNLKSAKRNESTTNESIFSNAYKNSSENVELSVEKSKSANTEKESLQQQFNKIKAEQGIIGKAWNKIKCAVNKGVSTETCEKALKDYQDGKISYKEANNVLNSFQQKQNQTVDTVATIATGAATVGAAIASGGLSIGATLAIGAGVGAVTKTGVKFADRATNEIVGDAANKKLIGKDAFTGAIEGIITSGTMAAGKVISKGAVTVGQRVTSSAKVGGLTGGSLAAGSVIANDGFDYASGDRELTSENLKDTGKRTFITGVIGTATGAVLGVAAESIHIGVDMKAVNKKIANGQTLTTEEIIFKGGKPTKFVSKANEVQAYRFNPKGTEQEILANNPGVLKNKDGKYYITNKWDSKHPYIIDSSKEQMIMMYDGMNDMAVCDGNVFNNSYVDTKAFKANGARNYQNPAALEYGKVQSFTKQAQGSFVKVPEGTVVKSLEDIKIVQAGDVVSFDVNGNPYVQSAGTVLERNEITSTAGRKMLENIRGAAEIKKATGIDVPQQYAAELWEKMEMGQAPSFKFMDKIKKAYDASLPKGAHNGEKAGWCYNGATRSSDMIFGDKVIIITDSRKVLLANSYDDYLFWRICADNDRVLTLKN